MTDSEILERVNQVIRDVLGNEDLTVQFTTTAGDVDGWDSLTHVQIIVAIEKAFSIRFRTGDMAGIADVGDLVSRISRRVNAA